MQHRITSAVFVFSLLLVSYSTYVLVITQGREQQEIMCIEKTEDAKNEDQQTALCQIGQEYTKGKWIFDESVTSYPYVNGEDDYEWSPRCTEIEQEYNVNGIVPSFLKYRWDPDSCNLARFDRDNFCKLLDGKKIGIIGDSMQQQLAHSFIGLQLGTIAKQGYLVPPSYSTLYVPLCPRTQYDVTLLFLRHNKFEGTEEDRSALSGLARSSDYLIMNWGVHYQPWPQMVNATQNFIEVLEHDWKLPQKKPERLFWRSTVVAHADCANATGPVDMPHALHGNPFYNTDEIMLQSQQIVEPMLRLSPLLNVTFLNIGEFTLMRPDGHRVVGHRGNEDCLHYCEPGPTDSWVELFYHHIVMGL